MEKLLHMKKLLITAAMILSAAVTISAQEDSPARTHHRVQKSYNIFFEINSSKVDETYKTNERTLEQFEADCRSTILHGKQLPDTVYIHATASPDGPQALNQRLAKERAISTKDLLISLIPELNGSVFVIKHQVDDWDGLHQILLSETDFPQRDKMLLILSESEHGGDIHKSLKECTEGWTYFVDNYIYGLRNSTIGMRVITDNPFDEFYRDGSISVSPISANYASSPLGLQQGKLTYEPEQKEIPWKKMIMAARTNLLTPGMSVGVEFPIKDNWSVGIDYMYPWILPKSNKWCLELIGGFIEAKYWFPGKKYQWNRTERLQGHAIGVYGGLGYYDFQQKDDGLQGEYIDFGVDYTFAMPVANGKLRMEFNIGVGFIRSWYRPYYMSSDYEDLIKEPGILYNTTNFIGPTRAGVSLVVPIVVKTKAPRNFR